MSSCRGGGHCTQKEEVTVAPGFYHSPVVIIGNCSGLLICVGLHMDSLPVPELRPTYVHPECLAWFKVPELVFSVRQIWTNLVWSWGVSFGGIRE